MPISTLPTPPSRSDPANFAERADDFLAALPVFVTETNLLATGLNNAADLAIDAETAATAAAGIAAASANYKGLWSALTGPLLIPASVLHNDKVWMLEGNLGDVTASQPGVSSDWTDLTPYTPPAGSFSYRNKVINGNFGVNQSAVTGTVVLTAGQYGHDQWKAGASGCTYTFSTAANVTTVTISAGTLVQVIEGINLESGTHLLSWTGTATGRADAASFGASGQQVTVTGGTNVTLEFSTGTVARVQLEQGTVQTPFELRPYTAEEMLCFRYFWKGSIQYTGSTTNAGRESAPVWYPVKMRVSPTIANIVQDDLAGFSASAPNLYNPSEFGLTMDKIASSTTLNGRFRVSFTASARL